ncbi:MAG TPA: peptidoglycan editing factor PgeF [Chloroflexota bacterium]|nr:peptidoglycan editing factor PgeF [Chloroflexota bacterium]
MLATLARSGIASAVSDRALGNLSFTLGDEPSAVLARRAAFARSLGFAHGDLVCAEQVHGDRVVRVGVRERGAVVPGADGLITDEPGVLPLLLFADCVPVCLLDPEAPAVGIAHAGWKGTVGRIAAGTVAAMVEAFGSRPDRLRAAIGPSIGGCCYEVSRGIAEQIQTSAPHTEGTRPVVRPGRRGRPHADLAAANRAQLLEAGLRPENVALAGLCTACRVDRFFSHRAEAGRAGRFGAAIGIVR